MATRIPVKIIGNLTADPKAFTTKDNTFGVEFDVAVNDRYFNEQSQTWENGDAVYHKVSVYGPQAKNAATSLRKGVNVVVDGEMRFRNYADKQGNTREAREIIAENVGVNLKFTEVTVPEREVRTPDPKAEMGWATPQPDTGVSVQ